MADRPLKIGLDGRELIGKATGVGRYLAGLIEEWKKSTLEHTFTLFVHEEPAEVTNDPRWTVVVEPTKTPGTWWEQTRLPAAARRAAVDVWFSPGYSAPLRLSCPFVVAIHDVSFFAHPEWFGRREGVRRRWLARAAARRAASVITISEFSASEIVRWLEIPRDRVHLAPPGARVSSAGIPAVGRPPMVLFVGSLFTRRRIPEMLRMFADAAARLPEARLVLVGDNRTYPAIDPIALARDLGIDRQVEWHAYVSDDELNRLYESARVFLFLSEYEGFAMTPLEALAHGVPPVLLDTSIAREIYGSAVTLVKGSSNPLIRLLTDDAAHAEALTRGRTLLSRYSWSDAAAVVLTELERAARPR